MDITGKQKLSFRGKNPRRFKYKDETLTITQFAEKYGLKRDVLASRLSVGYTISEAIEGRMVRGAHGKKD